MDHGLRSCFDKVVSSHTAAYAHYQIWFTLRGQGKAIDSHFNEMNNPNYVDFFHAANAGNYKLMFIEISSLFDSQNKRDNPACIRKLKELLIANNLTSYADDLESGLSPYRDLVSNIKTVRSKIIAHKDLDTDPEELYAKHGIVPDMIKELLAKCGELLRDIEKHLSQNSSYSRICRTDRFEVATFSLLDVLRMGGLKINKDRLI